ncbi:MAG: chloride channel protein [Planctomycetes bacterium]|nr:chloride channel protein [Planctomycetota bacterium]
MSASSSSHIERARKAWADRSVLAQALVVMLIAVVMGIAAGAAVFGFHALVRGFHILAVKGGRLLGAPYLMPLVPVVGMLIVAWIVKVLGPGAYGHGIPEVISAVANKRSRINVAGVLCKTVASALCIAWGGAVGKVGPVAQLGSMLGSAAGRTARLPSHLVKLLVGCGSAAAIAACFDAPLAGVLFASEVILRKFDVETIVPVVIASVVGASFTRVLKGGEVSFDVPEFTYGGAAELPLFVVLGLLAGVLSVFFIWSLYRQYDLFRKLRIGWYGRAALAGLILGVIGLRLPEALGVNYGTITGTLLGRFDLGTMIAVAIVLPLLAGLTLSGGGSGGVFAPCMATGAALGGAFGMLCGRVLPWEVSQPGAFAVVGAAALLAGAVRAPFTAILIVIEVTGNHAILLPLMAAAVVSILVSKIFITDSIYVLKLTNRGETLTHHEEIGLLADMYVEEVMTDDYIAVTPDEPASRLAELSREEGRDFFPVVTPDGTFEGMVSARELVSVIRDSRAAGGLTAKDCAHEEHFLLTPVQDLLEAFREFGMRDVSALPVVEDADSRKLVAVVTRGDLLARYRHEQRLRKRI